MADFTELKSYSLTRLVSLIITGNYTYQGVRDIIEEKVYLPETNQDPGTITSQMSRLADELDSKSELDHQVRYDVFLITGESYQIAGDYQGSVKWLEKAVQEADNPEGARHSLGVSYMKLREFREAAESFEKEIGIAPGNYYTYFLAADMWMEAGLQDRAADITGRLLERDPNNIRALHWLVKYYEDKSTDTSMLKKRILDINREFISRDYIIWVYYMKDAGRVDEALEFLRVRFEENPEISIIKLLMIYLFICKGNYSGMKNSLDDFKRLNHGREKSVRFKLEEFGSVFGSYESMKIESRLHTVGIAGI